MLKIIQIIQYRSFKVGSLISLYIMKIMLKKPLKNCKFYGIPDLELHSRSSIDIADEVTINSKNAYYHISMYSKCKFISNTEKSIIKIGKNTRIHGSCLHAKDSIIIGKNVLIAGNCQIIDNSGHLLSLDQPMDRINTKSEPKPVVIEDGVWLGANSIVLPGVTIGAGSVIAAGSVVTKNIPRNVLAAGNPAKVVKELNYSSGLGN